MFILYAIPIGIVVLGGKLGPLDRGRAHRRPARRFGPRDGLIAIGAGSNPCGHPGQRRLHTADPVSLTSVVKPTPGYSNSVAVASPAIRPLTDVFALPAAFPLANVFSVSDVLIGIGAAATIVIAMRTRVGGRTGASG